VKVCRGLVGDVTVQDSFLACRVTVAASQSITVKKALAEARARNASAPEQTAQHLVPQPQPNQADHNDQKRCDDKQKNRIEENHDTPPAGIAAFRSSLSFRLVPVTPL